MQRAPPFPYPDSPLAFREEALVSFDPVAEASWASGEEVPFAHLASCLSAIEKTTKRLEIVDLLTNALRCILVTTPIGQLYTVKA